MKLPKRAGDTPIAIEVELGKKYAWCTCGLSSNQPLCDGQHKTTEMKPEIYTAEANEIKYFCCCKATKKGPFCDGSHKF